VILEKEENPSVTNDIFLENLCDQFCPFILHQKLFQLKEQYLQYLSIDPG
jgi:hypothetical protein